MSVGVNLEVDRTTLLRDTGCTRAPSNATPKGFLSLWGMKEPLRTPRQVSLLVQRPKALNRVDCQKAVPTVYNWHHRFYSAAVVTISS